MSCYLGNTGITLPMASVDVLRAREEQVKILTVNVSGAEAGSLKLSQLDSWLCTETDRNMHIC